MSADRWFPSHGRSGSAWRRIRLEILERDGYRCGYCGQPAGTVDHIQPLIERPDLAHVKSNLVAACKLCQRRKGASTFGGPRGPIAASVAPAAPVAAADAHRPPEPPYDANGLPRPCESFGGPAGGHIGWWWGKDGGCHSRLWFGDEPGDAWHYHPEGWVPDGVVGELGATL